MDELSFLSVWIEFVGAVIIAGYCVTAWDPLLHNGEVRLARLRVAEGVLVGMNFKVAATLLKTIELHSWGQIGLFILVFALRTIIKWLFTWEQQRVRDVTFASHKSDTPAPAT